VEWILHLASLKSPCAEAKTENGLSNNIVVKAMLVIFLYTATTKPLTSQVSAVAVAQSLEVVSNGHVELGQPFQARRQNRLTWCEIQT
jgi:hypothetical protein